MRSLIFLLILLPSFLAATPRIGILCAHPKELGALAREMEGEPVSVKAGGRNYVRGRLWGQDVVVATSRIGKVAAAITATHMIESEEISALLFIGAAGALAPDLERGDVVIASALLQHDLDSRPLAPQFSIPLLGVKEIATDPALAATCTEAAKDLLRGSHRVVVGLIASGDQFIAEAKRVETLLDILPGVVAVEMEGGAVAQVCYEYGIPFAVVRTISDRCDNLAGGDCLDFLTHTAPVYTQEIVRRVLTSLDNLSTAAPEAVSDQPS